MKRSTPLTEKDLKRVIDDLHEMFHVLHDDELFVAWFLRAFVTEDESAAVDALTGEAGDKSNDAVFVNDESKTVFSVQGRYHQPLDSKNESRSDVVAFTQLAPDLLDSCGFDSLREGLAPKALERLTIAKANYGTRESSPALLCHDGQVQQGPAAGSCEDCPTCRCRGRNRHLRCQAGTRHAWRLS